MCSNWGIATNAFSSRYAPLPPLLSTVQAWVRLHACWALLRLFSLPRRPSSGLRFLAPVTIQGSDGHGVEFLGVHEGSALAWKFGMIRIILIVKYLPVCARLLRLVRKNPPK